MEKHVDQESQGDSAPVENDRTDLLNVNSDESSRKIKKCAEGCSRAVHCSLTLPFLAVVCLAIFTVACFYANDRRVGGCVLFGVIDKTKGLLMHGPNAACLTVVSGEMVVCAFAVLCSIVLVVKAFRRSKLLAHA